MYRQFDALIETYIVITKFLAKKVNIISDIIEILVIVVSVLSTQNIGRVTKRGSSDLCILASLR